MKNTQHKGTILVVDDTPENLHLLTGLLVEREYTVRPAPNGELALNFARTTPPDLILLDINMPGIDGYEVCTRLKADGRTHNIPVIFVSARDEVFDKVKAFALGGVDYITKPFQPDEVLARLETHMALRNLQKCLQENNQRLQEENNRRQEAEIALQRVNETLEERVKIRTIELEQSNKNLKTEISERERIELALQASEHQYRLLIEKVADGIGIIQNETFVFVNDTLASMLGYTREELLGKLPSDLFQGAENINVKKHFEEMTPDATASHWQVLEFVVTEKGGDVWLEGHYSAIRWEGHPALFLTVRDITDHKHKENEIQEARKQLLRENIRLKSAMKERYRFGNIIGKSLPMQAVYELITRASATDANVIIYGESGTGKDLIAQTIHTLSKRRKRAFVPVNCGSIQETLFESEFFGYRKGAFTGALKDKPGFFDAAHQGTLFLDEVAELLPAMQVKLLRAIEGSGYNPVGDQVSKQADVRIIAATNKNMAEQIKKGLMRPDFYYRINVITIKVPPLRERREDIPLLVEHVLHLYGEPDTPQTLPGKVLETLYNYAWPGNIRQLQNVLQRYLTLKRLDFDDGIHPGEPVNSNHIVDEEFNLSGKDLQHAVDGFEKRCILMALHQNRWNRGNTAAALGITPRTLHRKMQKYVLTDSS